jgi:superfamily I DNA/RNA helicase
MVFKPSKYQQAVYTYIEKGKGNAVISAVAGSGKSTTIVNALKIVPKDKKVLFLAFNKAIVEELKIKVGNLENVEVSTLHSLGCRAVQRMFKSKIASDKYTKYLNEGIKFGSYKPSVELSGEGWGEWKDNIKKLIDLARMNLVVDVRELEKVAHHHNMCIHSNEAHLAMQILDWGKLEVSTMDFADMIWFPNVKEIRMEQYDWVFIDECQDLNAAQRELFLKCLKPDGRFIAVGDPQQSIYGFAGADVESFNLLKAIPRTVKLPLSVCYRCDAAIIAAAREIVPQIEAREGAEEGTIDRDAKIADVRDGDMVLCRVTAPLVRLCMKYISNGVKAFVKGRDIGTNLTNMINKTKMVGMQDVMYRLNNELYNIKTKLVNKLSLSMQEAEEHEIYRAYADKVNAIEYLAEGLEKADDVCNRINAIFSDEKQTGICLSTIHKSKGLENDRVFVLAEEKLHLKQCMKVDWMAEQEKNLVYVLITRAKHYLGYIKDFEEQKS